MTHPTETSPRNVCFVTGTRSEFGLMATALDAIRARADLRLQIIATGMHLDPSHGQPLSALREAGARIDHITPWPAGSGRSPTFNATCAGNAIADLAGAFERLGADVVLVVGDRPEALAAAVAGHLSHRIVAHVHGGDRALGQVDDSLRHAITKLAHVHFPATAASAERIARLGEDPWRIHAIGSPGNDRIVELAAPWDQVRAHFPRLQPHRYAILLLHPACPDEELEHHCAGLVLEATRRAGFERLVILHPNNDPGCAGIARRWNELPADDALDIRQDLPRGIFLGLLRDAAALVGNSSSGIIEAASYRTPVLDVGPRQEGRERSGNVVHCDYDADGIATALIRIHNGGSPLRAECPNVYGSGGAGRRMADILASLPPKGQLLRKLISF